MLKNLISLFKMEGYKGNNLMWSTQDCTTPSYHYYYIRYQNLTYGKGLEYTTLFKGKGSAEIHKHCIQVEISKGNKVANKNDLQILDIRKISKKDYEYFTTQGNPTTK